MLLFHQQRTPTITKGRHGRPRASVCQTVCLSVCLSVGMSEFLNFALLGDLLLSVNDTLSVLISHYLSLGLSSYLSV